MRDLSALFEPVVEVIVQKVREAEREQVVEEYQDREGELSTASVKRVDRNGVYIDLGAAMPRASCRATRWCRASRCGRRTASRRC